MLFDKAFGGGVWKRGDDVNGFELKWASDWKICDASNEKRENGNVSLMGALVSTWLISSFDRGWP